MMLSQATPATVFVVDDDEQMRQSLVALTTAMGFSAQGFASGHDFLDAYCPSMPGCLVLDVQMPGLTGLELYEQMIREGKRLPVIFVTAHADVTTAVAAMKTGAIEFLEKPFSRQTLLARIQTALQLDATWRRREDEYGALDVRITRLTERERETLELVLAGTSNKVMAARLFISERAVEMRRAMIMRKLQVRSLAELLELAITHRILGEITDTLAGTRLR
jgi:FixJ family two-component response regulator